MKIEKKHIIIGIIGLFTITGAILYAQYRRLMNYTIKFKNVKFNQLTATLLNFDLFINFTNNSDLKFDISEQDYKVYLNDKLVTKLVNMGTTTIMPKSTSVIPVNVKFNPTEVLNLLGKNWAAILLHPETINIRVEVKLKVSLYGIKFSIPYVYNSTLKEMMAKKPDASV